MTLPLPFPDVRGQGEDAVQGNFEEIQRKFPLGNMGDRDVAYGTSTSTWSASAKAGDVTIAHGLGRVPVFAAVCYVGSLGAGFWGMVAVDVTNLTVSGWASTSVSTSVDFYWVAVA